MDDCLELLDSVEVRRLVALLSLIVDLVAIDIDLQDTRHTGSNFNRNCVTTGIHKLVDHPGRYTVVLSGYAIYDLNIYQTFASHNRSSCKKIDTFQEVFGNLYISAFLYMQEV